MTPQMESAMSAIPPEDRDIWLRVGMALHSEFGDDGFNEWVAWSERAANYDAKIMRQQWASFKASGGVTMGTLYALARRHGWQGQATNTRPSDADVARRKADRDAAAELKRLLAEDAARRATKITGSLTRPPWRFRYLVTKGFPNLIDKVWCPVRAGALFVPLYIEKKVTSGQWINEDGEKRFMKDSTVRGAVWPTPGRGSGPVVLCEGFATALSLRATGLFCAVGACMSAWNIEIVAKPFTQRPAIVVADHDKKAVGEKCAASTGLPWWKPEREGDDANDVMVRDGVDVLRDQLREFISANGGNHDGK